jgi:hypothetical protein
VAEQFSQQILPATFDRCAILRQARHPVITSHAAAISGATNLEAIATSMLGIVALRTGSVNSVHAVAQQRF